MCVGFSAFLLFCVYSAMFLSVRHESSALMPHTTAGASRMNHDPFSDTASSAHSKAMNKNSVITVHVAQNDAFLAALGAFAVTVRNGSGDRRACGGAAGRVVSAKGIVETKSTCQRINEGMRACEKSSGCGRDWNQPWLPRCPRGLLRGFCPSRGGRLFLGADLSNCWR